MLETITAFFTSLTLSKIIPAVLILVIGLLVARAFAGLFTKAISRSKLDKSLHKVISSVFRFLLYGIVVLIAAEALGINTTSLIAVLSVLSLAVSLAVQGTLSNVAGSVQVLSAHPFQIGDFVDIGDKTGTVEAVSLLYTTLLTLDNKRIYLPNSDVATSTVVNYSVTGTRRVDMTFSAAYSCAPETVIAALKKAAASDKLLPDQDIFCRVSKYGENAIQYEVRVWCKAADYWDVYFDTIERVHSAFKDSGVEMTYPHLNVHIEK